MKVKVTLRFRGREMAHKEIGFQQITRFVKEITPFGHPDFEPKLIGKSINLMLSPLPRNKRAKNPRQAERDAQLAAGQDHPEPSAETDDEDDGEPEAPPQNARPSGGKIPTNASEAPSNFGNSPFANIDLKTDK